MKIHKNMFVVVVAECEGGLASYGELILIDILVVVLWIPCC